MYFHFFTKKKKFFHHSQILQLCLIEVVWIYECANLVPANPFLLQLEFASIVIF